MTPDEAADFVEAFARRYVAEREQQEWRTAAAVDAIKAQGWVLLQAAAALRDFKEPGDDSPSIDVLELTVRTNNCLTAEGIKTVHQLMAIEPWRLSRIPSLGRKSVAEIQEALRGYSSSASDSCKP